MSYLLLPSLEAKRLLKITDLSQAEAEMFIKDFEARVKASRTLNTPKDTISDAFQIYNLVDLSIEADYVVEEFANELAESKISQHRGSRAVFVDHDINTIIVGTSVVYGRNYAMIGFDDVTIPQDILDAF